MAISTSAPTWYSGGMLEGYMTVKEAAEHLGIKPGTVRQHISRGNIDRAKLHKIGPAWLIPVDEIDKLKDMKPGPKTEK